MPLTPGLPDQTHKLFGLHRPQGKYPWHGGSALLPGGALISPSGWVRFLASNPVLFVPACCFVCAMTGREEALHREATLSKGNLRYQHRGPEGTIDGLGRARRHPIFASRTCSVTPAAAPSGRSCRFRGGPFFFFLGRALESGAGSLTSVVDEFRLGPGPQTSDAGEILSVSGGCWLRRAYMERRSRRHRA